jgi:hypothetical protein
MHLFVNKGNRKIERKLDLGVCSVQIFGARDAAI